MKTAPFLLVFVLASSAVVGCGAGNKRSQPPPTYERWTLPPWEPPQAEEEEDPTAALAEMEGEWVVEPEEESGPVGEGPLPESSEGPEGDSDETPASPSKDPGGDRPEGRPSQAPPGTKEAPPGTKPAPPEA